MTDFTTRLSCYGYRFHPDGEANWNLLLLPPFDMWQPTLMGGLKLLIVL